MDQNVYMFMYIGCANRKSVSTATAGGCVTQNGHTFRHIRSANRKSGGRSARASICTSHGSTRRNIAATVRFLGSIMIAFFMLGRAYLPSKSSPHTPSAVGTGSRLTSVNHSEPSHGFHVASMRFGAPERPPIRANFTRMSSLP